MADVFRSGFAKLFSGGRGTFRPKSSVLVLMLTPSLLAPTLSAQAPSTQPKKPPQANSAAPADAATPPPAQIWLPPVQNPEHAPVIVWDGNLLTIDAENSSLSDIMLGIRSHTGASIEMPASANRERVAVHLGPAPIREVLSSLLYGTDFNYVIQSTEDDQNSLGKVVLISRDGEGTDDILGGNEGQPGQNHKVRLMPGYAAPGKRDFEVAHANAASATEDTSSTVVDTAAADSATDQSPGTAPAESASVNGSTDTRAATAETADSGASADNPGTLTASGQGLSAATTGTPSTSSSSTGGAPATIGEMEQNLQRMYQQRQQLQAQQNRPTPPQTTAP